MAYKSMFLKRKQNKRKVSGILHIKTVTPSKHRADEEEFDACVDEIFKENEAVFTALERS